MRHELRLLRYAGPHWRSLTLITATLLASSAFEVLQPWPMKLLVDQVIGGRPLPPALARWTSLLPGIDGRTGLLTWLALSTVVLFVGTTLLSMVYSVVSVALGQRMTYELGADLFRHLQQHSLLFHARRSVGDTIARVTGDPACVQVLVIGVALPLVQSITMLLVMFGVMWRLEPRLTLLSLLVVPFQVAAIRFLGQSMRSQTRHRRELESRMLAVVHQTLTAIPVVQAFTREAYEHGRFVRFADETVVAYRRATASQLWFKLGVGLVSAVGTAAMMWLGGRLVLDGLLTIGAVLVFLAYLAALYGPLNTLTYLPATLQPTAANADRVLEVLDAVPEVRDGPNAQEVRVHGHVRYEHVTFGYEAGRPALRDVSFAVQPGEVVAIVGPTGAGKTTLLNLLMRFFDPWEGRVVVDGHDVRELRLRSLREQVALVLQEPFLFPYTVAENIRYGAPSAAMDEIVAAAVAANADEFVRQLPCGYETVIGERGATLSGGERQRLSIARAFVKNAPILILDEPTSALDARTEAVLLDALERLMKGRTTFIIAHRLSTIRTADRILVLEHGSIVEHGRHAELLARGGLYALLYRQQMDLARHDLIGTP